MVAETTLQQDLDAQFDEGVRKSESYRRDGFVSWQATDSQCRSLRRERKKLRQQLSDKNQAGADTTDTLHALAFTEGKLTVWSHQPVKRTPVDYCERENKSYGYYWGRYCTGPQKARIKTRSDGKFQVWDVRASGKEDSYSRVIAGREVFDTALECAEARLSAANKRVADAMIERDEIKEVVISLGGSMN